MKIGIVGGGISGVSAASDLQNHGIDITLFEKESTLGGHAGWYTLNKNHKSLSMTMGTSVLLEHYSNLFDFYKKMEFRRPNSPHVFHSL